MTGVKLLAHFNADVTPRCRRETLFKTTTFSEGVRLQLRGEILGAFNCSKF